MLWGIDLSHHQGAFDLARARREGFDFAFFKATEGSSFVDSRFAVNLSAGRAAGLLCAAYHYQRGDVSAAAQVAHIQRVVPKDCPVVLDVEDGGGNAALTRDLNARLNAAGYQTPVLYLPRWYWQQIGSPDLRGLPPLWFSRYPDNRGGSAAQIYGRVPASYWNGYGGLPVEILQFSSSATVAGRSPIDVNAYRGSREQLAALFGGAPGAAPTAPEEDDLQPDERAALFAIQNELLGPRGPQGQIQGWGTKLGPRTVVAMLVEMFNTWQAGRKPKGVSWDVWPIDALFDANAAVFRTEDSVGSLHQQVTALNATAGQLAELLASDRGLDAEAIRAAVHDAVTTALQENVVNVEISGNLTQATGDGDQGAAEVGVAREQMEGSAS